MTPGVGILDMAPGREGGTTLAADGGELHMVAYPTRRTIPATLQFQVRAIRILPRGWEACRSGPLKLRASPGRLFSACVPS